VNIAKLNGVVNPDGKRSGFDRLPAEINWPKLGGPSYDVVLSVNRRGRPPAAQKKIRCARAQRPTATGGKMKVKGRAESHAGAATRELGPTADRNLAAHQIHANRPTSPKRFRDTQLNGPPRRPATVRNQIPDKAIAGARRPPHRS